MNWRLERIYENISRVEVPSLDYLTILGEDIPARRGSSKRQIADLIAKHKDLVVGGSSKDIRIQPLRPFSNDEFVQVLQNAGLQITDIKKPGEQGSTSGQLLTYIVQDDSGNSFPVVLGKGKGFGTRDEDFVVSDLREQINNILGQTGAPTLKLKIGSNTYNINGVESTPGTPKSDFSFTLDGTPTVFISHKAGSKPTDHQQYGGLSKSSGINISEHPEVISFVKTLKKMFPNGVSSKTSVHRPIKDKTLKLYAIFGNDYGKDFGINNVNALFQGNLVLTKSGNTYTIQSAHEVINGELPGGKYDPVLTARFSGSRGGNHGIKDLRTSISPIAKVSSNSKHI